ncbi:pecanex-like protein 1 isoform X2 [Amphibalanus amphitrite]|uniref:pecanex-like protein 1 isoform X2 n=1 Tax=Amphibalanus amphitrite TaxID=1232801 RepID=UPI001C901255|nr:pecanex-like protein 1 isoform X2 [Amphibalanus amphitrite]
MTSQSIEIFRHVLWTSVTGGWFYDPHQNVIINTIQLYFWILLLCAPFLITMYSSRSTTIWAIYCTCVFIIFSVIKFINYQLHKMYDTSEYVEEKGEPEPSTDKEKASGAADSIELSVLEGARSGPTADTPPVDCSSRNSAHELGAAQSPTSRRPHPATVSQTYGAETIDLHADVHQMEGGLSVPREVSASQRIQHRLRSPTSIADHPIDLISELPEDKLEQDHTNLARLSDQTSGGDHMPSSLSLGLVTPSEVEHIRESGIFDLPALLSAVRERVQNTMPSGYFRRTLSVSDTTAARQADQLALGHSLVELRHSRPGPGFSLPPPQPPARYPQTEVLPQGRSEAADADQSGSEDEARGSDSPLLGDQCDGGEWTRSAAGAGAGAAASRSPSRAEPEEDDVSLHSLTGVDRLFCDERESDGPVMSTAEQGAVPKDRSHRSRAYAEAGRSDSGRERRHGGHHGARSRDGLRGSLGSRQRRSSSPRRVCRRRRPAGTDDMLPAQSSVMLSAAAGGTHLATSHDDTTEGAVHYFQDEFGHWLAYTFDGRGVGVAAAAASPVAADSDWSVHSALLDSAGLKLAAAAAGGAAGAALDCGPAGDGGDPGGPLLHYLHSSLGLDTAAPSSPPLPPKHHYRLHVGGAVWLKVRFDRLALLALLDRNVTRLENLLSVLLALLTSLLAAALLHTDFYDDLGVFFFSFAVASSLYSLVKSVQPDAASPTHGHNRLVAFGRPLYFCLLTGLTLLLLRWRADGGGTQSDTAGLRLYGLRLTAAPILETALQLLRYLLLLLPLLHTAGLLPQVDTFAMYLLEQFDIHLFGGTACTSLPAAVYAAARSLLAVAALYGFAYGGLRENGDEPTAQHILFSIFCGLLVALSYHLSRSTSDPQLLVRVLSRYLRQELEEEPPRTGDTPEEPVDPLPEKLLQTARVRLKSDGLACTIIGVMVFAVHCSTVFSALGPELQLALWSLPIVTGLLVHYLIPQLRKQVPWLCVAHPILRAAEYRQFEVTEPARITWFERLYVWLCSLERNVLYPLVVLSALTVESPRLVDKFGLEWATLLVVVCGLKCLRAAYTDTSYTYLVLVFTLLLFRMDWAAASETMLVDLFVMFIAFDKVRDFLLKIQFVTTYIAPWQITWGSAFHAFAQPFSVPHSAMLFAQAAVSAALSGPLSPFLGSAVFISSYVRPVKFWERDYNTKRVDHSNTRLALHLDRSPGANDNNLNSIFYEHLTRSLQHSLYGDIMLGRWGVVSQGDCFVLASDYLNCLVHIIELGNGLVTFQVRGLEFRGTYCQQREVEAITEGVEEDAGCCCCEPGHLPHILSANQIFNQRWLAWEVAAARYVLEGYSISDNSATSMLQVFDLRKVLITYYVKSIIFYALRSTKLEQWLSREEIMSHVLEHTTSPGFVDVDPIFNMNIDEDYDFRASGITRNSFCNVYLEWIKYCVQQRDKAMECTCDSPVVSLCLALSLLGRRTLSDASHHSISSVEFFLYGLHALFKGDFRITSLRDEWVFSDMDLLRKVVAPGIRMSLKLHQDHFMSPEDYEKPSCLYEAIRSHDEKLVISHEGDPAWRNAVLSGVPSLLALRHILDDGADQYKIIMLNKRQLSFRVIKLNRECVRGLWAGQQQELIYLRNRNPERGSIQNAKQALRNIINSSCDQPIGYPIYVSPLTTSYVETHAQISRIVGGPISFGWVKRRLLAAWQRLCARCGEGCVSGGSVLQEDGVRYIAHPCSVQMATFAVSGSQEMGGGSGRGSLGPRSAGTFPQHLVAPPGVKPTSATLPALSGAYPVPCAGRAGRSLPPPRRPGAATAAGGAAAPDVSPVLMLYPTATAAASPARARVRQVRSGSPAATAGGVTAPQPRLPLGSTAKLVDGGVVYDSINQGRRVDVLWPDDRWRQRGGKNAWGAWLPDGRCGTVVHYWCPSHPDRRYRSHVDRTILLLEMEGNYVPVAEVGCQPADPAASLSSITEPERAVEV